MEKEDVKVYHVNTTEVSYILPKNIYKSRVGSGKKAYELIEVFGGFDIETTNICQVDKDYPGWNAYAYHMQIALFTVREKYVYLFRKWDHLTAFIDHVADFYDLGEKRHLLLWIANFSFEFQFIRKRFKWDEDDFAFFAKEERQPLKATYRGIEFRECLSISGGNLAQLAKDYCKTQKLITYDKDGNKISDLDYSIERNSSTALSALEEQYCINDVVILAEFSQYMFNAHIRDKHVIPMTKTSILMSQFKDRYKELCEERDAEKHLDRGTSDLEYKQYIMDCFPDLDTYQTYMRYLFRGGYVHANATYAGLEVRAKMRDITSDYPARMNLDYVPVTPFKPVTGRTTGLFTKDLQHYLNNKCCIIHAVFDFIECTTEHSIESKNKVVQALGARWDNGRLLSADLLEVWLTELDFKIYSMFMKWAGVTILDFYTADRGKQPRFVLDVLNPLYIEKNRLKAAGLNHTTEYAIKKSGVNTCYGAEVKRIRLEKTVYDLDTNQWGTDTANIDFQKEVSKQLLLPQWGIWVTAAARYTILCILRKLVDINVPVYYIDTDSVKYHPCHKAENIFQRENRRLSKRRKKRGLRDINFEGLAEYDLECKGAAVRFKALGAKRYIFEYKDTVIATVAGMPKSAIKKVGDNNDAIFRNFSLAGFSLTPEDSGKLTTRYNDNYSCAYINGELMEELSSVALYKIPFKITITDEYKQIIAERKEQKCKL